MSSWKDTVTQMHKNNRSLAEMSKRTGKTPDEIKTFLKEEKDKPKEKFTVYENLNPKTHKQERNRG